MLFGHKESGRIRFYLEDVIIFCKSVEKHLGLVSTVLSIRQDTGELLKLQKCSLFTDQVD